MFGNWLASFLKNISPYSFASPFFNGFAVSYDLCVVHNFIRLFQKDKAFSSSRLGGFVHYLMPFRSLKQNLFNHVLTFLILTKLVNRNKFF